MMERPYLDVDGNRHERSQWDIHHVFAQQFARGRNNRDWIGQEGIALPMFRVWHNLGALAMHNNGVPNLRLPEGELRHIITQNLKESQGENIYDRFLDMSSQVHGIANYSRNPGLKKEAARIARGLRQQTPYILSGQVRDLSEASREISE